MQADRITCPGCQTVLKIGNPALAGKKIACPRCKTHVTVPGAAVPVPEVDEIEVVEEDRPVGGQQAPQQREAASEREADEPRLRPGKPERRGVEDDPVRRGPRTKPDKGREEEGPASPRQRRRGEGRGGKKRSGLTVLVVAAGGVALAGVACFVLILTGAIAWVPGGVQVPRVEGDKGPPIIGPGGPFGKEKQKSADLLDLPPRDENEEIRLEALREAKRVAFALAEKKLMEDLLQSPASQAAEGMEVVRFTNPGELQRLSLSAVSADGRFLARQHPDGAISSSRSVQRPASLALFALAAPTRSCRGPPRFHRAVSFLPRRLTRRQSSFGT